MAFNKYEGDPRLILTENGADLVFHGGQPVMDQGIENAALISWFTAPGWVGNLFLQDKNQKVGSDFESIATGTITVTKLNDIQNSGERAWQRLIDSGLASSVIVRARNPEGNKTEVAGLIEPPGKDLQILLATKYGANWIAQKEDPAYKRI